MKNFSKSISVLLCAVICCSAFTVSISANAAKKPKKYVKSISIKPKAAITIPNNKKSVTKTYAVKVKVKGKAKNAKGKKLSKKMNDYYSK